MDILQALRMRNIFGTPPFPGPTTDTGFERPIDPTWGSDVGMLQPGPTGFSDPGFEQPIPSQPPINTPIPQVQQPPNQPINQQNSGLSNIAQKMGEMYTPESQASDTYNNMIQDYPNREDYKPGFWSKLGAAIIDYTKGSKAGNEFRERPYENKLADWKNQIGPAGTAANLERNQNVNERTMAYNTGSNTLREQSILNKEKTDEANIKIKQGRADVFKWKAEHPNHKIITPDDGHVYSIDPVTNEKIDLGKVELSLAEKYDLQQKNAISRINETGNQARKTEEVRQTGREAVAGMRGWVVYNVPDGLGGQKAIRINEATGQQVDIGTGPLAKPSSTGNKPETASNVKTKQYNAASQLKNTDPELGQFIKLDATSNGTFEIAQPDDSGWFGHKGPTPDQAKRINDAIYGSSAISPVASHTSTTPPKTTTPPNVNIPKGRVAVQDNNKNSPTFGKKFHLPAEQLQSAITQGYIEVK